MSKLLEEELPNGTYPPSLNFSSYDYNDESSTDLRFWALNDIFGNVYHEGNEKLLAIGVVERSLLSSAYEGNHVEDIAQRFLSEKPILHT